MARKIYPQAYTDGIVYGYVEVIKAPGSANVAQWLLNEVAEFVGISRGRGGYDDIPASYKRVILHATTNGKAWSYALRPLFHVQGGTLYWESGNTHCPVGVARRAFRSRSVAENPWHDLVAWAFKDMARRARLPATDAGALQIGVAYEREAPAEVGKKLRGPCGDITYTGYPAKIGAYDIEDAHDIVVKAITDSLPHWAWQGGRGPWRPVNLEVMLHHGKSSLGLAFAPGTGAERNRRTISLNDVMFKLYSADAIWRVVVHELCHHYRDEVFARGDTDLATSERLRQAVALHAGSGSRIKAEVLNTHDSVFVRELAKVDKKVDADPYAGICFNEYADPSLVADAKAAAEAKVAKLDWRPEQGRIFVERLKGGQFSVWWIPLVGSKQKVGMLNNATLNKLIVRIHDAAAVEGGVSARRTMDTRVYYGANWPETLGMPSNLQGFMELCERRWHFNFGAKVS
jgi:hypothetical protein